MGAEEESGKFFSLSPCPLVLPSASLQSPPYPTGSPLGVREALRVRQSPALVLPSRSAGLTAHSPRSQATPVYRASTTEGNLPKF